MMSQKQRKLVDQWNAKHKPGTRVMMTWDGGEQTEERTRSEAQLLSGHTAVIWLDGISGCRALEACRAITDSH